MCSVEYTIYVREAANDGPPKSDLPTSDQQTEAASLAEQLSAMVQIPAATPRSHALDAACAHGRDPGPDYDPDRFAPPNWADARTSGWPR